MYSPTAPSLTPAAQGAFVISAGLDLLSGVFGFLSSLNAASEAKSQASLIMTEAEANAQRYSEQAAQSEAQQKVMYLASGVTLAGSPVDALATSARIANENIAAILMGGEQEASNQNMAGVNASNQGRNALIGGIDQAVNTGFKAALVGSVGVAAYGQDANNLASLAGMV
jgi:hypothetical protein